MHQIEGWIAFAEALRPVSTRRAGSRSRISSVQQIEEAFGPRALRDVASRTRTSFSIRCRSGARSRRSSPRFRRFTARRTSSSSASTTTARTRRSTGRGACSFRRSCATPRSSPPDVVVTGNIDHLVVSDRGALAEKLATRGVHARGLRRAVEAAAVVRRESGVGERETGDGRRRRTLRSGRTRRSFSERSSSSSRRSAEASSWTRRSAPAATRRRSLAARPGDPAARRSTATPTRSRCARERLARFGDRVEFVEGELRRSRPRARRDFRAPDGILADLGVSSMQLERGRARLLVPPRRAARHAHGADAAAPPPTSWRRLRSKN